MLVAIIGCVAGLVVFGWLRYYWVHHEVAWRPETRFWQYLLPCAAGLAMLILSRRGGDRRWLTGLTRLTRPLWPVGVGGIVLAAAQWQSSLDGPWLLYAWMGLLAWGVWRVAPHLRLSEPTGKQVWIGVFVATVGMIVLHVAMQLESWRLLSFGYRDIGLFARALHNAAEGQGLWVDSLQRSILGEHAFFALWILVPLCKLGADPFQLLIGLSAVCLNGPALIVAWFVRRRFQSNAAALIAAFAWLMLPAHGCLVLAGSYGFHPIYMAVPLLLAGLAFGAFGHWRAAAVCMLLSMTIREDITLTVAAWGAYAFLVPKRRALGATVFVVAAAYLALAMVLIVPHYRGAPYPHATSHFSGLLEGGLLLPSLVTNLSFLLALMIPLAMLPLRSWRWACVALPSLAETMLTGNVELHSLCFHYYAPAMVVLFFASLEAWQKTTTSLAIRGGVFSRRRLRAGWCLLFSALVGQVYLGVGPLSNNLAQPSSHPGLRSGIDKIHHLRSVLTEDTTVTASYRIAAHFLDAANLWLVHNEPLGDVVIVDDRDNWDSSLPRSVLIRAHRAGGYQPAYADYHLVMLTREIAPTPLATQLMPQGLPSGVQPVQQTLGEGIALVGIGLKAVSDSAGQGETGSDEAVREAGRTPAVYQVTLVWSCTDPPEDDLRFGLTLGDGRARWGPFYFARGAYPTSIWQPGRLYRDDIKIMLPSEDVADATRMTPVLLH